jgi:hypothetical protein
MFAADLARMVEFSFGALPTVHGTGIPGFGREFWERARRFASQFPFARPWAESIDRLLIQLQPPNLFFKVDWGQQCALRITIYFRFAAPLAEFTLGRALAHAAPLVWNGPSPYRLAGYVGEPAPFIVGFRTGLDGHLVAMYYRVRAPREHVFCQSLPAFVRELSLPTTVPETVRATLAGMIGLGTPSILGVNSASDDRLAELKLDVAGVTIADALAWIGRHGADTSRVHSLAATARRLRVEMLSYCGARVGADGMQGWKLYMPVRPTGRVAAAPRMRIDDDQRRLNGAVW